MNHSFRCQCPITSAVDIIGDKWTIVIVKQMLIEGKTTFKDFTDSTEAIATNILSTRLKNLESFGLITKEKLPHNKKTNIYLLTERGLALAPVILELTLWSDEHLREFHPDLQKDERLEWVKENKEEAFQLTVKNYKAKVEMIAAG
ncbi:helix-turn-helix transcriptional regulator [bacterium SCSIO 12741]|nr:helix-turn-helix transcriptional regulator [bacterium SCSIO 12741]